MKIVAQWRIEYNTERPRSSSGELTPEQFREKCLVDYNNSGGLCT
jgi:transposase InsO family protein